MRRHSLLICILLVATAGRAEASYQTCGGKLADDAAIRCADGSIPSYMPGTPPPAASAVSARPAAPTDNGKPSLFGVWHTTLPGMAYRSAVDVPGAYALDIQPGLGGGDLTISANGSYVWNSNSGISGRWLKAEGDMPIVLLDDATHKRWKVGLVEGRLTITDGRAVEHGNR